MNNNMKDNMKKNIYIKKLALVFVFCCAMLISVTLHTHEAKAGSAMQVVNCNEWISLREYPNTNAYTLTTIPLGDIVYYISDAGNGFYYVSYGKYYGYALASYLRPFNDNTTIYGGNTLYVYNCNEWISLRAEPNTNARTITTIPKGCAVTFIATDINGFYYVEYNGYYGYALANYLTKTPQVSSGNGYQKYMQVVNCNEWITLRQNPDTNAASICKIPKGQYVRFLATASNGFYNVEYNGYYGYALASYLR